MLHQSLAVSQLTSNKQRKTESEKKAAQAHSRASAQTKARA
jgi:hypothetical protein